MKDSKRLKDGDIILNLKKIVIMSTDGRSSSTTCCGAYFDFETETKHGHMEDPRMEGEIRVYQTRKENGYCILKVKFIPDEDTD